MRKSFQKLLTEKFENSKKRKKTKLDLKLVEYKKCFGNTNITSLFETDDELIEKLDNCIKLNIEYDDLYVGKLYKDDLI